MIMEAREYFINVPKKQNNNPPFKWFGYVFSSFHIYQRETNSHHKGCPNISVDHNRQKLQLKELQTDFLHQLLI